LSRRLVRSCGRGGALSLIVIPTSALKSTWRWDDLRDPVRHLQGALRVLLANGPG
jgi:hypothetical protein